MTPKSNAAPADVDPVEARALAIVAGWDAEEFDRKMSRALGLARQQADAEELAKHDAVPANWAGRMAKAGVTSVALTWPGAPVAPSLCLPRGHWSIDPEGVWYQPEGHPRQFVVSPVVDGPGDHEFSATDGREWFTIEVVPPEVDARQQRVQPLAYAALVLDRLRAAGVTLGGTIDQSRRDVPDVVPASRYATIWLLGVGPDNGVGQRPTRTLAVAVDERRTEAFYPEDVAEREKLAGLLGRLPADVRPGAG